MTPLIMLAIVLGATPADQWPDPIEPIMLSVDLDVGESAEVLLRDGSKATIKLLDLQETRDDLRGAIRSAIATIEVNGQRATLPAANYALPTVAGGLQIDCAATKGLVRPDWNPWALDKDARLRIWPAGAPWIRPGTFSYPVKQRWFVGDTQMSNEPCFVNACDLPGQTDVYYHYGLDFGGAEGLAEVVAATDGIVVSVRGKTIDSPDLPTVVQPRGDVVYLRDGRGWYYRYSHLHSIDPAIKLGGRVKMGQKLGLLGKEGSSGGWAHLHFDVSVPQPSGRYGVTDAYAFAWQAYRAKHPEARLKAVARPHRIAWVGDEVTLDGGRSWSAEGPKHIVRYDWTFSDGAKAEGPVAIRRYDRAGEYSEIFNVTDADGRVDYDFAVVVVNDRNQPKHVAPTIHAVYWPSERIAAGDEVTFMVRSFAFAPGEGVERWDFGDGGPAVETRSAALEVRPDGARPNHHAKDGYAVVKHRYVAPGDYLVSVSRTNNRGQTATARLHVYVE